MGEMRNIHKIVVGKTEATRWEHNIRTALKK